MTAWQALYIKELKENRGVFVFLLLVALCTGAYALVLALRSPEPAWPQAALAALPYLLALVFPFLLIHSFSREFRGQTHYLLLSLPVPRWHLVLSKFAAVLTGSAALFLVTTLLGYAVFLRQVAEAAAAGAASHSGILRVSGTDFWILVASGYFSVTVLLLGVGTLIAGVRLLIRRFRGVVSALCFAICLYAYGKLLGPVVDWLGFLGTYELTIVERFDGREQIQHAQPELQVLLYSCIMGLLFLGLGTWLIHQRVEA